MNIAFLPVINAVDVPTIRERVPAASRTTVFTAIAAAMRTLPLDPASREPLRGDLQGLFKCRFASGLLPGTDDMRLAVLLDDATDTAVIWAVGFRDAHLPTDFYRRLRQRVVIERGLSTGGSSLIGKPSRRGGHRRRRREEPPLR